MQKREKQEKHSSFIDNIPGADLTYMQLLSKLRKRISIFLCFFIPFKDKIGITFNNAFQEILCELGHKPNKIWIDKENKF